MITSREATSAELPALPNALRETPGRPGKGGDRAPPSTPGLGFTPEPASGMLRSFSFRLLESPFLGSTSRTPAVPFSSRKTLSRVSSETAEITYFTGTFSTLCSSPHFSPPARKSEAAGSTTARSAGGLPGEGGSLLVTTPSRCPRHRSSRKVSRKLAFSRALWGRAPVQRTSFRKDRNGSTDAAPPASSLPATTGALSRSFVTGLPGPRFRPGPLPPSISPGEKGKMTSTPCARHGRFP
jgi:hypothetical protein